MITEVYIMKKTVYAIISTLMLIIFIISVVIFTTDSINCNEYNVASQYCEKYELFDKEYSKDDPIRKIDFLYSLVKILGCNDQIMYSYNNYSPYTLYFDDASEYLTNTTVCPPYSDLSLVLMADTLKIFAGNKSLEPDGHGISFEGYDNISITDAVVMLESCLEEGQDSRDFSLSKLKSLIHNAKKEKLVNVYDRYFYIPVNADIKYKEVCVLLYRFMNKPMYKYLNDENYDSQYINYGDNRDKTYLEYMETLYHR